MLHRAGVRHYAQFSRRLADILSPYHRAEILQSDHRL
jgi:hypothetical protein